MEFLRRQPLRWLEPSRKRVEGGMEGVRENLEAVDQAGTGTAEIGVAVDQKDLLVAHAGHRVESGLGNEKGEILTGAGDVESAAGDDKDLRIDCHDLPPGD